MSQDVVESFFGCYILVSTNPNDKKCTYIGFTVDPERRLKQHNRLRKGGARKTSRKGPWDMVLIVHGFPNQISALRFEWAWQHPKKSRRLKQLVGKRSTETQLEFRFRIMSEMLRLGPWNRLPLTVRWLKPEYEIEFPVNKLPPPHMPIVYGLVKTSKVSNDETNKPALELPLIQRVRRQGDSKFDCCICQRVIKDKDEELKCLHKQCKAVYHCICLADHFLSNEEFILPLLGNCIVCKEELMWIDLWRSKQGCYIGMNESDCMHWSQQLNV